MEQYTWFQSLIIFFYLYYYGVPPIIRQLTSKLYIKFSNLVNEIDEKFISSLNMLSEDDLTEKDCKNIEKENIEKYEDKYLKDIRKLNKELIFTEEEKQLREDKKLTFYNTTINKYTEKINEADKKLVLLNEKIKIINTARVINEEQDDKSLDISYTETLQNVDEEEETIENMNAEEEETIENMNEEINNLQFHRELFQNLLDSKENHEKLLDKSIEIANTFILNKHLERLQNCFVLETTPHGNVLMIYDTSKGSFKYYSDNTIPYRYLEPVARKYVKQFNCRPLYVDMEEELNIAEEKWEKERKEKEEEEKRRKEEAIINNKQPIEEKKNVFAKFKTYNKEAGTGRVNTGAPPKNSIPNKQLTKEQENEKILLKEKSNRYTYEGKLVNFNFLKKVERKVVDKNMDYHLLILRK